MVFLWSRIRHTPSGNPSGQPAARGILPGGPWTGLPRCRPGDGGLWQAAPSRRPLACCPGRRSLDGLHWMACTGWLALDGGPCGPSPHTRGWTALRCDFSHAAFGVPRTRGDGPAAPSNRWVAERVFPAHAGMDRSAAWDSRAISTCSPHTRGWTGRDTSERSPGLRVPRTRGDGPVAPPTAPAPAPVFPAHAGMDR